MARQLEEWPQDLLNAIGRVPDKQDVRLAEYIAHTSAFVGIPRQVAWWLIRSIGIDFSGMGEVVASAYRQKDQLTGAWWRAYVTDELHERISRVLARIALEIPDWLIISVKESPSGTVSFKVSVDYAKLAERIYDELHVHVGMKNGKIALIFAYNKEEGIYEKDGLNVVVKQLNEHLKFAQEFLTSCYGLQKVLVKKQHIDEVLSALRQFGKPVEQVLAEFNDYSRYIPVQNGILDMETGELKGFGPEWHYTFKLGVEYKPDVDTDGVEEYLRQTVAEEDLTNLKRFLGYLLVPGQPLKAFAILQGGHDSGKSTLLDLVSRVLGPKSVASEGMTRLTTNRFSTIKLLGKLANLSSETPELEKGVDTELLKAITGGDAIPIEEKFSPSFSAKITAKLIFAVNRIPKLPDDPALWSRVVFIRFPHQFQRSKEAYDRIMALAPALLVKMVKWRKEVLENGFETADIDKVRARALLASNPIKAFVIERLEEDPDSELPLVDAYIAFCEWAEEAGLKPKSVGGLVLSADFVKRVVAESGAEAIKYKLRSFARFLSQAMEEEGYISVMSKKHDDGQHRRVIVGIRLKGMGDRGSETLPEVVQRNISARRVLQHMVEELDVSGFLEDEFVEFATKWGFTEQDAEQMLRKLVSDGVVQEIRPGLYRVLEQGAIA